MKMLTENELQATVGGEGEYLSGFTEAQLQRLLDSAAAQQDLAYQAWIRSLLDSMAP